MPVDVRCGDRKQADEKTARSRPEACQGPARSVAARQPRAQCPPGMRGILSDTTATRPADALERQRNDDQNSHPTAAKVAQARAEPTCVISVLVIQRSTKHAVKRASVPGSRNDIVRKFVLGEREEPNPTR